MTTVQDERPSLPLEYRLSQNYPNPFNRSTEHSRRSPQTTIAFALAARGKVTLTIYNALGQEVEKLIEAEMPAGFHQVLWDAKRHTSGVYFYRLTAENFNEIKKMALLR